MNDLDIRVKVITFDADYMALAYVKQTNLPWPLILDPEQKLYKAYGMTRGSWWAVFGLPSIWKYLRLMIKGRMPGKPGKDWRQLGGNVLIDRQGIVRFHYISTGPHDRPAVEALLRVASGV